MLPLLIIPGPLSQFPFRENRFLYIPYIQLPAPWPTQYKLITQQSNCATCDFTEIFSKFARPTSFGTSPPFYTCTYILSITIIMVPPKVKNSKSSKSGIPSGIPSSGIPSTRSSKARFIPEFYQNSGEKSGNGPTESPAKSTSLTPPCPGTPSPARSPTKSEPPKSPPKTPVQQNRSSPVLGNQMSPTSQDGDILAPSQEKTPISVGGPANELLPRRNCRLGLPSPQTTTMNRPR